MPDGAGAGFVAKVKIKRKTLPTTPINVRVSASPATAEEGGPMGSTSPRDADSAAFTGFPSSQKPKIERGVKPMSGKRAQYK